MNRILIHTDVVPFGEYDIFHKTNHEKMHELISRIYGGNCPNFGNRLWFQGIISEITTEENVIDYWDASKSIEEINSQYDMVIAPMANVFSIGFKSLLDKLAQHFSKITIPIYVIACGVQADSYDDLDNVCTAIKEPATRFIRSVYNSGGEFALRGFFSKEFFERLGFHSAVVTGCPSLYQLGRKSMVASDYPKAELRDFSPIVNGKLKECLAYLREYPRCQFFDQHTYYDLLYGEYSGQEKLSLGSAMKLIKKYGLQEIEMVASNRVKLFPDMTDWMTFIQDGGFQFSFGSRIHGNIMPILSGIPAVVNACDSRTREMAEFFHIPMVVHVANQQEKINLYELYQNVDYHDFNQNFEKNFDNFERFLQVHGIVKQINTNNIFFSSLDAGNTDKNNSYSPTSISQFLERHHFSLALYDSALQLSRKVRGLA